MDIFCSPCVVFKGTAKIITAFLLPKSGPLEVGPNRGVIMQKAKKLKLTVGTVNGLPLLDYQYIVLDSECTGLFVAVSKTKRSYFYRYRPKGCRPVKVKIGDCDLISPAAARLRVKKIQSDIFLGQDPFLIRKSLKEEMTLADLLAEVVKRKRYKKSTLESVKNYFNCWVLDKSPKHRKHINYSIHNKQLSRLSNKIFEEVHNCIGLKSESSANNVINYLKGAFKYAVDRGYIDKSPITKIKLFPTKLANKIFNEEQRERILAAAFVVDKRDDKLNFNYYEDNKIDVVAACGIAAALLMGRRYKSEILNLKWEQINWNINKIYYEETKVGQKDYKISTRAVNLFRTIQNSRNKLIRKKAVQYKSKNVAETFIRGPWALEREYIFPATRRSEKPYIQEVRKTWKQLLKMCGIEYIALKQARHTVGTLLYKKTKNLKLVQDYMGHTDIKTTSRYLKIADLDIEEGLELLDSSHSPPAEKIIKFPQE